MPKNMFFNISEEKRKMFLRVAMEEFTSKSFEDVSVNSIVKKANISRGSFYTYFNDLESLFNYLFRTIRNERFSYAREIIKESNGDYFTFIKKLFVYDYDAFTNQGKYTLFRNYIHYIQFVKKGSLKDLLIIGSLDDLKQEVDLNQMFNFESYNITTEEFIDLIEVIILIMINTFLKSESHELKKEEAVALFNKRISYLEYGIRKSN